MELWLFFPFHNDKWEGVATECKSVVDLEYMKLNKALDNTQNDAKGWWIRWHNYSS